MSLARSAATVGSLTLLSRILGFVRDIALAALLGAGPAAEAFFVAIRLPNMFRRLFAEGAFTVAFVPMFARHLEQGGTPAARAFAEEAYAALTALLLVIVLVAQLLMPWLLYAIAWGFADRPETFNTAVLYARIAFPYLLFISVTALFAGVLNSLRRFAAAAAAPILLNLSLIASLALAARLGWPAGLAASWAVPVAGVLQAALVVIAARRAGMRLRLRWPRPSPEVVRLLKIAAPAALAAGIYQVHLLLGTLIASFFPGAVAWLQYADRLYQLPLGVVGIALTVVLMPELTRRLAAGDTAGAEDSFSRAFEISVALSVPAAVALAVIPEPLIRVLFERGAFSAADTRATAQALAFFAAGLPAFMLGKIYAAAFFAREDTRRPLYYAGTGFAINTVLAAGGAAIWGFLAIPAATSLAAWATLALFVRGLHRHGALRLDPVARRRTPRAIFAGLALAPLLFGAVTLLGTSLEDPQLRYPALVLLVVGGMAAYAVLGLVTGGVDYRSVRAGLRHRRGRP